MKQHLIKNPIGISTHQSMRIYCCYSQLFTLCGHPCTKMFTMATLFPLYQLMNFSNFNLYRVVYCMQLYATQHQCHTEVETSITIATFVSTSSKQKIDKIIEKRDSWGTGKHFKLHLALYTPKCQ